MMKIRQKLIFDGFYHGGCALQLIFKLLQKLPGPAVDREFFPALYLFCQLPYYGQRRRSCQGPDHCPGPQHSVLRI